MGPPSLGRRAFSADPDERRHADARLARDATVSLACSARVVDNHATYNLVSEAQAANCGGRPVRTNAGRGRARVRLQMVRATDKRYCEPD